nr:hypothetical protein GCM10020093_092300 [Planobispora longispora]
MRTVQNATGLMINHYVEVNVLGFINVVEALGGVSVCTPVAINDPKTALQLQPGTHSLDGVRALAYARTRATARSDLDRIDRQQQVISALLNQALSGDTLANPVKLTNFVNTTLSTLRVDDSLRGNLLGLADQLKTVSTDDVAFATVPLADVDYRTPTGESAVLWDKPAARELFQRIAADEELTKPAPKPSASGSAAPAATPSAAPLTVPPSRIAVKVLNGTLITGLGARTRQDLLDAGFLVPEPAGDTQRRDHKETVIRYGPGREDSARTLAAALPGADVRPIEELGDRIEVIVGEKRPQVKKVTVKEAAPTPPPPLSPLRRPEPRRRTSAKSDSSRITPARRGSGQPTEVTNMIPAFDVQTWKNGPCAVIRATGELDMTVAPRLGAEVDRVLEAGSHPCLVMDLTQVPFCDSVGLGTLVSALTKMRNSQGRLILVLTPGMITRLLAITSLDRHFETCGTLHEAFDAAA